MFARKARFVCPRCLREIKLPERDTNRDHQCPECKYVMPIAYIKGFNEAPPLFMQVFGWTQHGKTLFLDVLKIHFIQYLYNHWGHYHHQSLTQLDIDKERSLKTDVARGRLPGSTQPLERDRNEVYIMQLKHIPRWGSRTSVIMDHAGERFEDMNIPTEEMPFLVKTPTTLMIISLDDMINNDRGESMDHLLGFYIRAMELNQVDFTRQRRKLVFVFTKADKLTHLSPNLRHYLATDNLTNSQQVLDGQDLLVYLERMHRVSNEIKHWLEHDSTNQNLGSRPLMRLIESKNIEARYTIISALGQDISKDHQAAVYITPKRVLDPFFWTLEFQSR